MKFDKQYVYILLLLALGMFSCTQEKHADLKVLQLNTWIHGARVPGAAGGIVDLIVQTDPDVVLLCELDAGSDTPLAQQLIDELGKRGKTYCGDGKNRQTGILSKYTLENVSVLLPTVERHRPVVKAHVTVNGRTVAIYSAHLDHLHYGPYLPRGYNGAGGKSDAPQVDPDSILALNRTAWRDEAIRGFLREAEAEKAKGRLVIIGGDFNEPSHLDWQEDTKDIRDHRGAAVRWDVSQMLSGAGYVDAYRQLYPNALTHPGFTWPAGNTSVKPEDLCSADADVRDRIDFIYYCPQPGVTLSEACLVGPAASVACGKITAEDTGDAILEPQSVWPSDHKGNLTVFRIAPEPADGVASCPEKEKKLTFAFLTDVHLNAANVNNRFNGFKQALERAKNENPAFLIFGGDVVEISGIGPMLSRRQTDSLYTAFRQAIEQTGLPCYQAIGNHDRYFDAETGCTAGDEVFKSYFGDSYYTFEEKGVRFFVLNSVQHDGTGDLCIGAEQMEWLKRELVRISLATPIVAVTHVPVYSLYYPVVENRFVPNDVIRNYRELLHAFREHNLKLVLQGHQHLHEEMLLQDVQYITGGAVCAGWWGGSFHGTEMGFLSVQVDVAGKFTWAYVNFGWAP
ncbi:MAG: metallophosphoesterase [Tannerella sp.]|jgi:endonuclease/exonuclease/phosphatase family metal-dependent hydrolase/UDP-2,3-diacylglucosamine pyrophosphatase LpxH|nr:metallophosphoesterase [Tannerella sp.]